MKVSGSISEILRHKGSNIYTVSPSETVFDAITLMSEKNIGAVPVVKDGRVIGILSERDYTRKIALHGKSSKTTEVKEIMTSPTNTITPTHTIDQCMQMVTDKRCRHLPVVEGDTIVGMISIGDLVNWIINAQNAALEQMEHYISGGY